MSQMNHGALVPVAPPRGAISSPSSSRSHRVLQTIHGAGINAFVDPARAMTGIGEKAVAAMAVTMQEVMSEAAAEHDGKPLAEILAPLRFTLPKQECSLVVVDREFDPGSKFMKTEKIAKLKDEDAIGFGARDRGPSAVFGNLDEASGSVTQAIAVYATMQTAPPPLDRYSRMIETFMRQSMSAQGEVSNEFSSINDAVVEANLNPARTRSIPTLGTFATEIAKENNLFTKFSTTASSVVGWGGSANNAIDALKRTADGLVSVTANHVIGSFVLQRLMIRFKIEPRKRITDDMRRFFSAGVTSMLNDTPWVGRFLGWALHDLQTSLGLAVAQANRTGDVYFYLKGGRSLYGLLTGEAQQGSNDWDTNLLINPDLPKSEWLQLRQALEAVVTECLLKYRFAFLFMVYNEEHAEALINSCLTVADTIMEDPESAMKNLPPDEDLEIDADRAKSIKAEMIDVTCPARLSTELRAAFSLMKRDGVATTDEGLDIPRARYQAFDYIDMLRGILADDDASRAKGPKRLKRLRTLLVHVANTPQDFSVGNAGADAVEALCPKSWAVVNSVEKYPRPEARVLMRTFLEQFSESYQFAFDPGLAYAFDQWFSGEAADPGIDAQGLQLIKQLSIEDDPKRVHPDAGAVVVANQAPAPAPSSDPNPNPNPVANVADDANPPANAVAPADHGGDDDENASLAAIAQVLVWSTEISKTMDEAFKTRATAVNLTSQTNPVAQLAVKLCFTDATEWGTPAVRTRFVDAAAAFLSNPEARGLEPVSCIEMEVYAPAGVFNTPQAMLLKTKDVVDGMLPQGYTSDTFTTGDVHWLMVREATSDDGQTDSADAVFKPFQAPKVTFTGDIKYNPALLRITVTERFPELSVAPVSRAYLPPRDDIIESYIRRIGTTSEFGRREHLREYAQNFILNTGGGWADAEVFSSIFGGETPPPDDTGRPPRRSPLRLLAPNP